MMDDMARAESALNKCIVAENLCEQAEAMVDEDPVGALKKMSRGLMLAFDGLDCVLGSENLTANEKFMDLAYQIKEILDKHGDEE